MNLNIRMNIEMVNHFKISTPFNLGQYMMGRESLIDWSLAGDQVRRMGGGFVSDPQDGKRVYILALPAAYSTSKKRLEEFENSSELPTSVIQPVKDFDDAVTKNANKLLHVLNDSLQRNPDYFLHYEDFNTPEYFHKIDSLWLDAFVQLAPKSQKVRASIRQYLGVK
jgi:hypothetical protein